MMITAKVTPKLNTQYNNRNINSAPQNNQPAFTGFNISKSYDKFCEGVGEKFCRPVLNNRLINWLGDTIKNSENAVKHFLAVGSVITSGMYMKQTLTNDKMDKDRRQTLATNQFFTLVLSTAGAYTMDNKLKSWWKKQHEKFLRLSPEGTAVWDGMNAKNEKIKAKNKNVIKELQEPLYNIDKYIADYGEKHVVDEKALKKLAIKSKGFAALRSILVFGFVYRFFVPLVVVKPTNWICDKYLENKKAKQAQALNK